MAATNAAYDKNNEQKEVPEVKMPLFSGEVIIAQANVMRYNAMSNRSSGAVGILLFTNFRVAFTCSPGPETDPHIFPEVSSLENLLSEEQSNVDDFIPLTVIRQVYAVSTNKQKRKQIKHRRKKEISIHYDIIEVETKDFRIIQYDFKFAKLSERRSYFQAISHHMFPESTTNLFAFDYGKHVPANSDSRAFCSFHTRKDYEMNLSRLKAADYWRVSAVNDSFKLCKTLPEHLVVPAELTDGLLESIASKYHDNRFPSWQWSDPQTGVSLLLSADLIDKNGSFSHPIKLMEGISACQTSGSGYTTAVDVAETCPSRKVLTHSFKKLRKCFSFYTMKDFWSSDSIWLSGLEDSCWIKHTSSCLEASIKIVKIIKDRATSVIVHDEDGRNVSIVITSLVQILLDPYFRTHVGLQALIQKDWVMKGFPFNKRLGLLWHEKTKDEKTKEKEESSDGECPLLFLFLDCLHHLLKQNPMKFEYNEQFLILIYDCAYSSLFSTFLFNSYFEYKQASIKSKLVMVWDFIADNISQTKFRSVLCNHAYKLEENDVIHLHDELHDQNSVSSTTSSFDGQPGLDIIIPSTKIIDLTLWKGFFFRWFPCTDPHKGSSSDVILLRQQKKIAEEVKYLQNRFIQLQQSTYHQPAVACHARSSSNLSTSSTSSINRKKSKHKRNPSKLSTGEDSLEDDFLTLMNGFYFLKLV